MDELRSDIATRLATLERRIERELVQTVFSCVSLPDNTHSNVALITKISTYIHQIRPR